MDNQHKHIKGYGDLSAEEIALMNEIKEKGEELRALVERVRALAETVPGHDNFDKNEADHPLYWVRFADGSFRSGIMYLVRSVARSTSY